MLTFGSSAYLVLYAPERLKRELSPAVRRLALAASVVALATAIVWLALESAAMADDSSAAVDPEAIGAVLSETAFGRAWLAHLILAAALVAVVVFGPARSMGADRRRIGGAAGEPRPCRPRRDADRRRRRPAPRQPRRPPSRGGGLDRRPRSFRHVSRRLRAKRHPARGCHGDDAVFLLRPIHRRGDRSHRRRQHRADLRSSADPAGHALPRASGCENRRSSR